MTQVAQFIFDVERATKQTKNKLLRLSIEDVKVCFFDIRRLEDSNL